ncbi:RING-H2 finger protein ATL64 [Sesamum angolense]|uniref:RING-H2 finger protein ATL64 n=1 Tax=Sesamum angolense TaxID=2727404 RepID=A0AAE2BTG2_9LAMI|nr:RING-H2 finger protein ATL64 [Sesamum angolense]
MEFYLPFISKFTASLHGFDRLPAAEVLDRNSRNPPPYCAICLSDVRGGDRYRKLQECGHCFHAQCIDAWFKAHSTCPLCRTQMIWVKEDHHHYRWGDLISDVVLLFRSFVEKLCNPLNDELASMLCDNVRCISS